MYGGSIVGALWGLHLQPTACHYPPPHPQNEYRLLSEQYARKLNERRLRQLEAEAVRHQDQAEDSGI